MNRRELLLAAACALGGVTIGSPTLRVLAGERPEASASRALFDAAQSRMVSVLAEMIVPATDTPGAIEAGTPAFIEMMVCDWYTATERAIFLDGIAQLDAFCQDAFGAAFLACGEEQRIAALGAAEQRASAYTSPLPGGFMGAMAKLVDEHTPFFAKLRELTVIGYYGSEIGARQELSYNPMPMRYDGDYDYAETGRQWTH